MKIHLDADISYPSPKLHLAWATSIMVLFVLPLSLYLGKWNIPTWVSFVVWAEYFALGANRSTWRVILPSLLFGIIIAGLWCGSSVYVAGLLESSLGELHSVYAGYALTNLFWIPLVIYSFEWNETLGAGALPVFNGFTMLLAVYFTGSIPDVGPIANPYYVIGLAAVWTLMASYLGWVLGWFNVFLTFRDKPQG